MNLKKMFETTVLHVRLIIVCSSLKNYSVFHADKHDVISSFHTFTILKSTYIKCISHSFDVMCKN